MSDPANQNSKKRCKYDEVKTGDYFSEVQYYRVLETSDQAIDVQNERGFELQIAKPIIEEGCWSANQYSKEIKINRTDCVNHMLNAQANIFTVNFNKKPTAESYAQTLQNTPLGDFQDPVKLKKLSKELDKGDERTLIGYLVEAEPLMGRSKVIDLEEHFANIERKQKGEAAKPTLKQVDHRHINWLIIHGTKYVVK